MRFGSVCSGIEAAGAAWFALGWEAAWFAEIEGFAAAVLYRHYPHIPNLGDMTALAGRIRAGEAEAPDLLVGGTPCQAFSVAGRRQSLKDERGNLSLTFCEIADEIDIIRTGKQQQPGIIVWENVPGVLSTTDNAFGCFLGKLSGAGSPLLPPPRSKWGGAGCVFGPHRQIAWRILDAQFFGVPQRRRRIFLIATARKDLCPAEILFESGSMPRHSAPCTSQTTGTAAFAEAGFGGYRESQISATLKACGGSLGGGSETLVVRQQPVTNRTSDIICINANIINRSERSGGNGLGVIQDGTVYTLTASDRHVVAVNGTVRKLTPLECERLQGFPDHYTQIPWRGKTAEHCPDTPRYRVIGNSMAVPVMKWIGKRIQDVLDA